MSAAASTFEIGELYVFSDGQSQNQIWGIFEGTDVKNRILLEIATSDFKSFQRHIVLPQTYDHAESAPRCDLRDFAYSMGYNRI